MPVEIDGETFESHDAAVRHLKKSKPQISDPDAYVATVERKMKQAQLKSRIAKIPVDFYQSGPSLIPNTPEASDKINEFIKKKKDEKKKTLKAQLQKLADSELRKTCPVCNKHFETNAAMNRHVDEEHEDAPQDKFYSQ